MEVVGTPAPDDVRDADRWHLVPESLFDGDVIRSDVSLVVEHDMVAAVVAKHTAGRDGAPAWRVPALLSPGFFDIQVNGGGGVLFNTDPTPKGLAAIAKAHRPGGTTALLPTLITDTPEVLDRAVDAMLRCVGRNGILGIHIEGPHISIERKGAHHPALIRPFDKRTQRAVETLRAADCPVLLTLAPECVPAGTIAHLTRMGVRVSLGHTAADAATVRDAFAEGAVAVTHLFNAMTPMASRAPGVVGAALDSDAFCGIIADGHHVDDTVVRLACRSRARPGRMVAVSDAMPTWGGPGSYTLYGETIALEDGCLVNASGSLAGVHIDLGTSVRRLVQAVGLRLDEALGMATSAPARMMGLDGRVGAFRPGQRLNAVLLDSDLAAMAVLTAP